MSRPPIPPADQRILSGSHLLSITGWVFWLAGIMGPRASSVITMLGESSKTGRHHGALSAETLIIAAGAVAVGAMLIALGVKIRQAFHNCCGPALWRLWETRP